MLLVKKTVKHEDGNYSSTWNLSEEQLNYLLTFAINMLVAQGIASIEEVEAELEADEKQDQLDFLIDTPAEGMGQA